MSKPSKPWPRQAFVLSNEIINSLSHEEMEATWTAMYDLGIAKPPYENFDILLPIGQVLKITGVTSNGVEIDSDKITPAFKLDNELEPFTKPLTLRVTGKYAEFLFRGTIPLESRLDIVCGPDSTRNQEMAEVAIEWIQVLIILLATKNVTKETVHCKSVRLGIGVGKKHEYTTTLKIGAITEHTSSEPTGKTVRAHLRRGHVRRQHYGPRNEYIKKIWIPPTFVNADEEWIGSRTAYNVSLALPSTQPLKETT